MLANKVLSSSQLGGETYLEIIGALAMTCELECPPLETTGEPNPLLEENYRSVLQEFAAGRISIGEAIKLLRQQSVRC